MKKLNVLTRMLLLVALLVGSTSSVWAADVITEGFETATAGTEYQGTVTVTTDDSDCGVAWEIYYGAVSTSSAITGDNSAALRLYTSNNYGYLKTTSAINDLRRVSFKAKAATTNGAAIKINLLYSANGSDWSAIKDGNGDDVTDLAPGTSASTYKYDIPIGGKYFKIEISSNSTNPSKKNAQLTIDDVQFTYGTLDPASEEFAAINTTPTVWNLNSSMTGAFSSNGSSGRYSHVLTATDGTSTITYIAGKSCTLTNSYLKPGGKSTFDGTANDPRYFVLHIAKSGVLTITSNNASGKQGNYLVYQAATDDISSAVQTQTITTSAEQLTASGSIDIANGAYVYIGWEGTLYTESLSWAEADGISITTTANMDGWRAFYDATQDYLVDANTKIYVAAKSGTENQVELTEVGATKIPHGEAVILKTSADDHKMVLTKTTGAAPLGDNVLAVTDGSSNVDGYRMGYGEIGGEDAVGFFKYTTTTAPAAGIVYIDKSNVNIAAGARGLAISFGDDNTTIIEKVKTQNFDKGDYFNLNGQRVAQPTKGLYIVNGKKVVIR